MAINNHLEQLGLQKNQIKVYLALFEIGKTRAGKIIDYTGLHRNIVYTSLAELVEMRLVTKVVAGKVAEYSANSPQALVEEAENKMLIAKTAAEKLTQMHTGSREVQVYEGLEGIKRTTDKSLDTPAGSTLYILGGSSKTVQPELERHWKKYHRRRIKQGQKFQVLYDRTVPKASFDWRNQMEGSAAKFLPFDVEMPMWFSFCEDRLSIIIPGEDPPLTFEIKSRPAADGMKQYFDHLWNQEFQVRSGPEAVKDIWLEAIEEGELKFINARGYFIDQYPDMFEEVRMAAEKRRGVEWKNIVDSEVRGHAITKFPWMETKYSVSGASNPNVVWLYGDKVAISNWAGDQPVVFISTNKQLVQSYQDYFEQLWNQKMLTLTGEKGLERAFADITDTLKPGEELLVFGIFAFDDAFFRFIHDFHAMRAKNGISARIFLNDQARHIGETLGALDLTEVKYMPEGMVTPTIFLIYGNKTLINLPNKRTFFQIEDQEVADTFRQHFNGQWNQEAQVLTGNQAMVELMNLTVEQEEDIYLIAANGAVMESHPKEFARFNKDRIGKNMKYHILANQSIKGSEFTKLFLSECTYLPEEFESPMVVWICGNIVANILWEEPQRIFVSRDKHVAESYRNYYSALQKTAKK